jgi:hypothetical protein
MWKAKRELRRAWQHLLMIPEAFFGEARHRIYDRKKPQLIRLTRGMQPQQTRVAVFLIYQPSGILASTLQTCRHLSRNGFAVVAVSNAPISDTDRTALLAQTYQVMERPNFGYDFGGYRDGILHVIDCGMARDQILVLNDSIWFPLKEDCDFLERIKAQTADVYGPVLNRLHLQSYMYVFGSKLIESAFFRELWETVHLSNNKEAVIRRCEKLLSPKIEAAGYAMGSFLSSAKTVEALHRLPDEELYTMLRYDQLSDTRLGRAMAGLELEGSGWRDAALECCRETVPLRYLLKDHPTVLIRDLRLPLLKKDRAPHYALQRATLMDSPVFKTLDPIVAEEIAHWD